MLQYTAVYPKTLGLLRKLMQEKCLSKFNLFGGTALALQLGHRISVDIDLFSKYDFDTKQMTATLSKTYKLDVVTEFENSLIQKLEYPANSGNFIKVDIIKYPYKLIRSPLETDGIRLLTNEDIIPMKLSAIGSRDSKKDFFDIFFLLQEFSIKKMFDLFEQKSPNVNYFHIIKSLTYFEDADTELNPKTLKKSTWQQVKNEIKKQVKEYI
jgi:hypothetical protein